MIMPLTIEPQSESSPLFWRSRSELTDCSAIFRAFSACERARSKNCALRGRSVLALPSAKDLLAAASSVRAA